MSAQRLFWASLSKRFEEDPSFTQINSEAMTL